MGAHFDFLNAFAAVAAATILSRACGEEERTSEKRKKPAEVKSDDRLIALKQTDRQSECVKCSSNRAKTLER
jgi:hypothetical protein